MFRVVFLSLFFVGSIYFASWFLNVPHDLISPKTTELEDKQAKIDQRVFEENKEKVKAKPFDFAQGVGKPQGLVENSAYIVVNGKGKVVYALNPDTKQSPASLVKLMTAMVVLDTTTLSEVFTVPKEATGLEPTILIAEEGEKFTVSELLRAMLIVSANDAAETLAHGIAKKLGGSREVFVKLMNEKAKNLGLTKTQFANPMGYDDPKQFSTARDLAKLAYFATSTYPTISEIVGVESASIAKTKNHKKYELPNWNSLLGLYPGADGIKIGFTDEAGHVTIVSSKRDGERFTAVLLGAPDRRARDLWAVELLNSAFGNVGVKKYTITQDMLLAKSNEWSKQLTVAQDEKAPIYNDEPDNLITR